MLSHHRQTAPMRVPVLMILQMMILLSNGTAAQSADVALAWPQPAPSELSRLNSPTLAAQPSAGSAAVFQSKDWQLTEIGSTCTAGTTANLSGTFHRLEIAVDKTGVRPVMIQIRAEGTSTSRIGFEAGRERFVRLSGPTDLFWNVPRRSDSLVKLLKRDLRFDVASVESAGVGGQKLTFSLRGSSATISELAKRCAAGGELPSEQNRTYEVAFLTDISTSIDIRKHTPATTDLLFQFFERGFTDFIASNSAAAEIAALNTHYLNELTELSRLDQNLDRLQHRDLVRLQTEQSETQSAIQTANSDLVALRPQVATREAELNQANIDYEATYRQIQPYMAENNRLQSIVDSEESRLRSASSRLSNVESNLARAERELHKMESDAQGLRGELSSVQSSLQEARRDYDRASMERSRFDSASEVRRRQTSDSRLGAIEREIDSFEVRIRAQENAIRQAESERNNRNSDLARCKQAGPGADCGREQAALVEAQRRFHETRNALEQLENNRRSLASERERIIDDIERDVHLTRDSLARAEAEAQSRLRDTENRSSDRESRLRSLTQVEIPSRQNEISRLESERLTTDREIRSAQNAVALTRNQLSSYRRSVGYDALETKVNNALSRVNQIKTELSRLDRDIKRRDSIVADGQKRLGQIDIEIQNTLELIKQKQARSADVQKLLQPYETEKSGLLRKKAVADQSFEASRTGYLQTF